MRLDPSSRLHQGRAGTPPKPRWQSRFGGQDHSRARRDTSQNMPLESPHWEAHMPSPESPIWLCQIPACRPHRAEDYREADICYSSCLGELPSKCSSRMPSVAPSVCPSCERAPHWDSSKHHPGLIPVTHHQASWEAGGHYYYHCLFSIKKKILTPREIWFFGSRSHTHNLFESRQSDPGHAFTLFLNPSSVS